MVLLLRYPDLPNPAWRHGFHRVPVGIDATTWRSVLYQTTPFPTAQEALVTGFIEIILGVSWCSPVLRAACVKSLNDWFVTYAIDGNASSMLARP